MKTNTTIIFNAIKNLATKSPSIPKTQKFQGGFEKCAEFLKCFVSYRNNKRNVVDTSSCCGFSGRVEGLALSQPLMYFFTPGVGYRKNPPTIPESKGRGLYKY